MAFNKGLRFVDSAAGDRYSLTIDSSSQSFFESNSASTAYGAMVLTIRPATGAANDKEALIVGDNLAVGIQYNEDGSQYRLLLQDRVNYGAVDGSGPNDFSFAHNTVFSEYAAVDVETTFAFNWNANGTASIVQTGEAVRTKFMSSWDVQNNALDILIPTTAAAGEDFALVLDDGKGSIAEVAFSSAAAGDEGTVATKLKEQIDALDGYTATVDTATITVTRTDGASFTVAAGTPANSGRSGDDKSGTIEVGPEGTAAGSLVALSGGAQGEKGGSIGMDPNYDGFISQIAEFNKALSVAEMNGYVTDPSSVPDPVVSGGTASKAVVTVTAAAAEDFVLKLDDGTGNVTAEFKSDGDAAAKNIYTELETAFANLSDANKAGFTVTAVNNNAGDAIHLDISRADGADFIIENVDGGGTDLTGGGVISVNGIATPLGGKFASSQVGESNMDIVVGTGNKGQNYQIVLDDGSGNQNTVSVFGGTDDASDAVATELAGKIDALAGYTATASAATVTVKRATGEAFKVKLGSEDEAGDLTVDTVALTTSFVTAKNSSVDGTPATLTNGVKQNFDFTNLDDAIEVVSAGPTGYTSEATLSLKGTKLDDGTLATLASTGTVKVDSSNFEGGAPPPVLVEGAVASNGVFAQVRDVEGSVNSRTMAIDLFVDPQFSGETLRSLSYTIAVDNDLNIVGFDQVDANGGFSVGSPNGQNISARWFSPSGLSDLKDPIATIQVAEDGAPVNNPTFTFSNVEVNSADLTDGTTYTATFVETLDAALVDIDGELVSGLDNVTKAADHYVLGKLAPGATVSAPTPTSGLYLDVASWQFDPLNPTDSVYTLAVKAASAIDLFEFDLELPGQVDPASVVFTPDVDLPAAVAVATNAVAGRTLEVEASGASINAGATLGEITVRVPGEFGKVQFFELTNVQTNSSAANENGRGLYVGVAETDANGAWSLDDMGAGLFNREYQGGPAVSPTDVSAIDAFYALQVSAGLVPTWYGSSVSEGQVVASDFDGSGKVTAADALAILEYVDGTNVPDPAPTVYEFYHDAAGTTDATVTDVDGALALVGNHVVTTSDLSLTGQNDRVVLIGDLSDPSA